MRKTTRTPNQDQRRKVAETGFGGQAGGTETGDILGSLSAAEAAVLMGSARQPYASLKLALIELVVTGHVVLERHVVPNWFGLKRRRVALRIGAKDEPWNPVLHTAQAFVAAAVPSPFPCGAWGKEARNVKVVARDHCGALGFRASVVEPALLRARLLEERPVRFLSWQRTKLAPSPQGAAVALELRSRLACLTRGDGPGSADAGEAAWPLVLLLSTRSLRRMSRQVAEVGADDRQRVSELRLNTHSLYWSDLKDALNAAGPTLESVASAFKAISDSFDSFDGDLWGGDGGDGGGDGGGE